MQFSLDRKQRRHKQNQCSASDSFRLIFTRSYRSTLLITTPTTRCNNLNSNPKKFYNTFNPFLNHKTDACAGNNITLNINGKLETNQETVAEHFADYFSTMANNIGGTDILNLKEENFSAHVCVQNIRKR